MRLVTQGLDWFATSMSRWQPPRVIAMAGASMLAAAVVLAAAGWPQPNRIPEFSGLVLAAMLASVLATERRAARVWTTVPLSFVIEFTALLLLGPEAMLAVATAGVVVHGLANPRHPHPLRSAVVNAVVTLAAAFAAGWAHQISGGTIARFTWPEQGVPIVLAVVAYCALKSISFNVLIRRLTRQPIDPGWPAHLLRALPGFVIGSGVAAGVVTLIEHRLWGVTLVGAVPVYFAYQAYAGHVARVDEERRRQEVREFLDQGMAVVDRAGLVTLWNDGLERILNCPRERAVGQSLLSLVPAFGKSDLPRAIAEALKGGGPQTVARLMLPSGTSVRTLQVRVLPVAGGATVLWDDLTRRTKDDHALKRRVERLALAAEGANDGLWEWDSRSQEFYCSNRWRAMLGLPPRDGTGHVSEWFGRIHDDDRAKLKAALDAHLTGTADHFQHEHRIRHEDGSYRTFLCRGVAVRGPGRVLRLAGSLTEVTERAAAGERAPSSGSIDQLTRLGNRAVFVERLGQRLEEFKQRRATAAFAAVYLDLDRFKVVNDNLGHLVGDQLLAAVSRRLETCVREGDALARLGGDEFAILLNELGDPNQANVIAFRIQEALKAPFSIGGREVFTSASIGIAFGNAQYNTPDEIMRDADTAMYHAKSHGKARHELFDADMHARELDRVGLESDLRHAVSTNGFEVYYQPIVLLGSGMCVGFESLARWTRNGKPVSPATFVPLAEELGIIEPLGTWMLQNACTTFADWKRRFPDAGLDYVTVNVSSRQLMQQNYLRVVERAVEQSGIAPCDLRLEITETALMENPKEAAKLLSELRAFGTKIYLDDFGCGFSSLSHLATLPVDALKIDRSFVKNLLQPERPAIVESILALARTLNTRVVAEGIEQEQQARELERLGCTHAQGFLFSRPVTATAAEELIAARAPLGPRNGQPKAADAKPRRDEFGTTQVPFEWPDEILTRK
jgi:diguanylate cyclase (GGDEF)-like protein/PAS domain S-box-containing protein